MTIGDIESIYTNQLQPLYEKDEARSLASHAVQNTCGLSKSYVMLHKSHELTLGEETTLIRILDDLRSGAPLQYVLGEADFYGLKFKVSSSVLIPRPETEELVFWVLDSAKRDADGDINIIDLGTGSGCIPIAIKKNLPQAEVSACDISQEAIDMAINNAVHNQAEVHFFHADILSPRFSLLPLTFNIIISNPPYIRHSEKVSMHKNVLAHEPHTALFVPDEDPLLYYKSIADFSLKHLSNKGLLFLEINEAFGRETETMLHAKGFKTEHKKDIQGKDRMIKAWLTD